jgi:hypothetical protein
VKYQGVVAAVGIEIIAVCLLELAAKVDWIAGADVAYVAVTKAGTESILRRCVCEDTFCRV